MTNKTYRFAIIGAGNIGKHHAATITTIDNATLVAVCDIIPERAQELAEKHNCAWYTDINEILKHDGIDIVTIGTPSGMHAEHVIACAKADKHIICEKPIEVTMEKAKLMNEACKQAGVKLAVISQHRFQPSTVEVKKYVDNGRFGKLILGTGAINWYRSQEYYDSGEWRATWELDGGGALMNQGVHTVDVLQHLMGPVDSVYAHCETLGHERMEVEDTAVATLRFRSGAIGTLVGTTCAFPGLTARIMIVGKDGSAVIDNDQLVHAKFRDQYVNGEIGQFGDDDKDKQIVAQDDTGSADPTAIATRGHARQFIDMLQAIEEDRDPAMNGNTAQKPLEIILAIYESARTGLPIKLSV